MAVEADTRPEPEPGQPVRHVSCTLSDSDTPIFVKIRNMILENLTKGSYVDGIVNQFRLVTLGSP